MPRHFKTYFLGLVLLIGFIALFPHISRADDYQLLAPLPLNGVTSAPSGTVNNFQAYIPNVIKLVIALAGAMAVVAIVLGGMKYVLSASAMSKSDGKDLIQHALIGLLLAVSSWLILHTINPDLVVFNLAPANINPNPVTPVEVSTSTNPVASGGTAASGGTSANGAPAGTNQCGTSCVNANTFNFPKKDPGTGCSGSTCLIDPALGKDLANIAANLSSTNVSWQVTEMTPPTVNHLDTCHGNGTCVDATISGLSSIPTNDDVLKILTMFAQLDATPGLTYVYEACGPTLDALKSNRLLITQYLGKFVCESTTQNGASGQSLHIEGPNASNPSFGLGSSSTS